MASLLAEFKGKVDLIYIDPPFDVGADFTMDVPIGDEKDTAFKDQSLLEMVAYRDMWGKGTDSYLHMMFERLTLMKELLSEKGSIYVHCDWHVGHYLKVLLDDVLGRDFFLNELIWLRTTGHSDSHKWNHSHDTLFYYSKGSVTVWNEQFIPYNEEYARTAFRMVDRKTGRRFSVGDLMAGGLRKGESGKAWRGN
jgi:adenine specific DNA methylase Mod